MVYKTAREKLEWSGLRIWHGKTLDEMTDAECEECLREIARKAGVYYI